MKKSWEQKWGDKEPLTPEGETAKMNADGKFDKQKEIYNLILL